MDPMWKPKQRFTLRRMTRTFITGLLAVLPLLVTFAVVMWLIGAAETLLGGVLRVLLPSEAYWPGMGLIFSLGFIFVVGMLMQAFFFREFIKWTEEQLERIPLIKTVYGAVRDLTGFFSREDQGRFGRVVMVELPSLPFRMIGFITVERLSASGLSRPDETDGDMVAVYLPMSYQIGGYTVLLPRSCLTELDMSFEQAMRWLITAGAGILRPEEVAAVPMPVSPIKPPTGPLH